MCFSPEASFASGALLAVAATVTIRKAWTQDRSMLVYALFPAIFALHQLIEGMVWTTLDDPAPNQAFRYAYIAIAFVVWPTVSPLAAVVADRVRRRWLVPLLVVGASLTLYLVSKLIWDSSQIDVARIGHSLCYTVQPADHRPPGWVDYIYGAATILPMLICRNPRIKLFGLLVGAAYGMTYLFLHEVYFSTWCMASALLSAMIYIAIPGRPWRPGYAVAAPNAAAS